MRKPRPRVHDDPDKPLVLREPGRLWNFLVGLVLAGGGLAAWAGTGKVEGLIVVTVGVLTAFTGNEVRLERAAGTAQTRSILGFSSLGLPWRTRLETIAAGARVRYREKTVRSGRSTTTVFRVALDTAGGTLELVDVKSLPRARLFAVRVARYLGVPLRDDAAGVDVPAAEVGRSLRERALEEGREAPEPDLPERTRLRVLSGGDGSVIEVPARRLVLKDHLMGGVAVGAFAAAAAGAWIYGRDVFLHASVAGVFAAMLGVPLLARWLFLATARVRLEVSTAGVRLRRRLFGVVPWSRWIDAEDLEMVEILSGQSDETAKYLDLTQPCLRLLGGETFFHVGHGLSDADLEYLRAKILAVVTA